MRTGFLSPLTSIAKWQTSPCHKAPGREACHVKRMTGPSWGSSLGAALAEIRVSPRSANILRTTCGDAAPFSRRPSSSSVERIRDTEAERFSVRIAVPLRQACVGLCGETHRPGREALE